MYFDTNVEYILFFFFFSINFGKWTFQREQVIKFQVLWRVVQNFPPSIYDSDSFSRTLINTVAFVICFVLFYSFLGENGISLSDLSLIDLFPSKAEHSPYLWTLYSCEWNGFDSICINLTFCFIFSTSWVMVDKSL